MNVSFIDHLDIAFSSGAVLLLLFLIGAFCACRKELKWILGKRFMHQLPATPTNQLCTSTAINMPTIASALVVITFSKADAERLRLIKRELRLTSDYYKSD